MHRIHLFIAVFVALLMVGPWQWVTSQSPPSSTMRVPPFASIFDGRPGTFLLHDPQYDLTYTYNLARADLRLPPYSTFKIYNAAIALETGSMPDLNATICYDASRYPLDDVPRTGFPFAFWRQDHNLASAMQYSVVWFYTDVAHRTGQPTMQAELDRIGYGNRDVSAWLGTDDDPPFWLGGSLEISANEQLELLLQFSNGALFSERTTRLVRSTLLIDEGPGYTVYGKTGAGAVHKWLVGWVARGENVYFYVMNGDMSSDTRSRLVQETLEAAGLLAE